MKIYYARTDILVNEDVISSAMELLPECRLQKLNRMKSNQSRIQCIAAGLLLEYGLREYGICGKNVTFHENRDGKPSILEHPELHFNLSHSGEYVALVMSSVPVGIDIEKLRSGQEKLVKRFFSEEEAKWLMEGFDDAAFTKMWTRKEAFIKARGIGMRMPLDSFSTTTDVIEINDKMPVEMRTDYVIHYVKSHQINEEYWLSVCQEEREEDCIPVEVKIGELL